MLIPFKPSVYANLWPVLIQETCHWLHVLESRRWFIGKVAFGRWSRFCPQPLEKMRVMSADRPQGCHQSQRLEEGGGSTCQRAQRWLQTCNLNIWHQVKAFCSLCWLGYKPLARLLRYLERLVYRAAPDRTFPTATEYISHIHLIKEPRESIWKGEEKLERRLDELSVNFIQWD